MCFFVVVVESCDVLRVFCCCYGNCSTRAGSGGVASTHFQHTDRQGNHAERYATTTLKPRLSVPEFVSEKPAHNPATLEFCLTGAEKNRKESVTHDSVPL